MSLPARLQSLLDHAQAEAKRAGHGGVTLLHLVQILRRRAADDFRETLGADAAERLDLALRAGNGGSTPDPVELLQTAATTDSSDRGVLTLVKPHFDVIAPPAATGLTPDATPVEQAPPGATPEVAAPQGSPGPEQRLDGLVQRVAPDPQVLGRRDVVDRLITVLGRRQPGLPCLVGAPGVGRTSILGALAHVLEEGQVPGPLRGRPVYRLVPEACLANGRANAITRVLDELDDGIVVIDDLEVVAALGGQGADIRALGTIRSALGATDPRLVLTIAEPFHTRLSVHDAELTQEIEMIRVEPLDDDDLRAVAAVHGAALAAHHEVDYPSEVLVAAPSAGGPTDRSHPGLLVDRLDHAGTVAALREDRTVQLADLGLVPPQPAAGDLSTLDERLKARIRGQDQSISVVAARLALTRSQMDLRPERPDGVFLFAGPTGVGKTALARALCVELFGDEDRLIRLDMSEFMHEWAVTRLIGPAPGYVGSTQPEEWLTTRVREQSHSVILLDEIEKAHPKIWTTFLQVFDAGRLSDLQGEVSFAHTIIILTTNLGATTQQSTPIGFSSDADDPSAARTRAEGVIKDAIPPEMVNRLDGVVVFNPLGPRVIREIAADEIQRTTQRLAERGYVLEVDDGVIDAIADAGYEPAYGARHLQRNIERLLLQPLVTRTPGKVRARLGADGAVRWEA
jgi:ATP-dependent Clp protease ATP-binding subunit ClpA